MRYFLRNVTLSTNIFVNPFSFENKQKKMIEIERKFCRILVF